MLLLYNRWLGFEHVCASVETTRGPVSARRDTTISAHVCIPHPVSTGQRSGPQLGRGEGRSDTGCDKGVDWDGAWRPRAVQSGGPQLFIAPGLPAGEGPSQLPWSLDLTYHICRS